MRNLVAHRRRVLPAVLLAVLAIAFGLYIAFGSAPSPGTRAAATATPTPTPTPTPEAAGAVTASLAAVQQAFNAGDLPRLCRRGGLVDPAVIRQQDGGGGDCEAEIEALISHSPPLRLTVHHVTLRSDLASVALTNADGNDVAVDMVRSGGKWLLSFSDGTDPMPVLAGTT